jgi:hypothetical protein
VWQLLLILIFKYNPDGELGTVVSFVLPNFCRSGTSTASGSLPPRWICKHRTIRLTVPDDIGITVMINCLQCFYHHSGDLVDPGRFAGNSSIITRSVRPMLVVILSLYSLRHSPKLQSHKRYSRVFDLKNGICLDCGKTKCWL